jgi:hypothetical protein
MRVVFEGPSHRSKDGVVVAGQVCYDATYDAWMSECISQPAPPYVTDYDHVITQSTLLS